MCAKTTSTQKSQSKKRKKTDDDGEYRPSQPFKKPRSSAPPSKSQSKKVTSSVDKLQSTEVISVDEEEKSLSTTTAGIIRLVNAHTNESFEMEKPKQFSSLQTQIAQLFNVDVKDIESISNISDHEIRSDSQLTNDSANTILFYLKSDTANQKGPSVKTRITTQADIVPHVNILIHGGDEYDFITALAELIDNSIQNTCMNAGERIIDISMEKATDNSQWRLHIWDNGRGMNFDGIVEWAKLGVTRPPSVNRDMLASMPTERSAMYLTNDFSRYGVGSKKAIFNLGSHVTMCTRPHGSKLVHETTLSRTKLETDYEQGKESQWKIQVESRTPNEQEEKRPSFTHITISDLKEVYIAKYESAIVRRNLSHIYHYYIFGPKGNRSKELGEESDDEDLPGFSRNIAIRVDGKSISHKAENDLESQYLQQGLRPWTFEMKIVANVRDFSATQLTQATQATQSNKVQSVVKGVIYYYPYKDGHETLPIPYDIPAEESADIPLSERDPGFECFWNGRLLSGEKSIKGFPFMAKDKTRDIPDICYRRVKGMLFFDSAFEVSANKLYLCKQTPICQALIQYDERKLKQNFKKWLKSCHNDYDEEIKYGAIDTDETNKHRKGVTFYKDVTYGSLKFAIGTKVAVNSRPKIVGTIDAIFLDSSSQDYGCSITIKEWSNEGEEENWPVSTHNISKVEVLSTADFKKEKEKLMKRKPQYVDLMDTDKVPIADRRPPSEPVEAGFSMKYITAGIYCGDGKVQTKEGSITLTITNETTGKTCLEVSSEKPGKGGKHVFKMSRMKFTECGRYKFEFQSENLKSKIYKLDVTPSSPHHLMIAPSETPTQKSQKKKKSSEPETPTIRCSLGHSFSLPLIYIADQFNNAVNLKEITIAANEIVICSNSESLTMADDYKVQIGEEAISIDQIRFDGGTLSEGSFENTDVIVSYGVLEQKLHFKTKVLAGEPRSLGFTVETRDKIGSEPVKREIPIMELFALDQWNNAIKERLSDEKLGLKAESTSLEQSRIAYLDEETGLFSYTGENALLVQDDPTQAAEYSIIVNFALESDANVSGRVKITVAPGNRVPSAQFIQLIPREGQEQLITNASAFSADVRAIVNEELSDWRIQLLDKNKEKMEHFFGRCEVSWHTNSSPITNGECKLPLIQVPTACDKKTDLRIEIFNSAEKDDDKLVYRLSLTSIIGPPVTFKIKSRTKALKIACFDKFNVDFTIQDSYGNEFDAERHRELYKEFEEIIPIPVCRPLEDNKSVEVMEDELEIVPRPSSSRFSNIKLKGTAGKYELLVQDSGKIIKSAKIPVELMPGPIDQLKANGMDNPTFTVMNYGCLPSITVMSLDAIGNVVVVEDSIELSDLSDDFEIHPLNGSSGSMTTDDEGNSIVPMLRVRAKPGTHKFKLSFQEITKFLEVTVEVQPSYHPTKIVICNKVKNKVCVGETVGPFEVYVEAENGQQTKVPRAITLEIEAPEEKQSYTSIPPNSQSSQESITYKFPDTEKCLTRVGNYRYRFIADLSELPYGSLLEGDAERYIVTSMQFSVDSGKPRKLETRPLELQLPAVTNAGDLSRRSFFDELMITAVDDYKNIAIDFESHVTVSVQKSGSGAPKHGLPTLEGNLKVPMKNGRAKFGPISVKQKTGKSGMYKLIFSCQGLQSKELEFCFSDDAVLLEKQNALIKKRDEVTTAIAEQEKIIEKARLKHDEAERQLNTFDQEIRSLSDELDSLSTDYHGIDWHTENIDKIIKSLDKQVKDRQKNSDKVRPAKYGLEKHAGLQHVMKLKSSEGDTSNIVGIIGDICYVDNEELDKCLSKLFGGHMQTVIVHNKTGADHLKKQLENLPKITILPLDNFVDDPGVRVDEKGLMVLDDLGAFGINYNGEEKRETTDNGFVGYACNLIQLRQEHNFLRRALFNLLRDTAVFRSYEEGMQFRTKRIYAKKRCPKIVTLDGETIELSGILYAGKEAPVMFRFGQMSLSSDSSFQNLIVAKDKLAAMKMMLKKRREYYETDYNTSQNEFNSVQKSVRKLGELKQKHSDIQEQIRKLSMGGAAIEESIDIDIPDHDNNDEEDELIEEDTISQMKPKTKAKSSKSAKSSASKPTKTPPASKKRKAREEPVYSPELFADEDILEYSDQEDEVQNWTSDDDDHKQPSLPITKPKKKKQRRK